MDFKMSLLFSVLPLEMALRKIEVGDDIDWRFSVQHYAHIGPNCFFIWLVTSDLFDREDMWRKGPEKLWDSEGLSILPLSCLSTPKRKGKYEKLSSNAIASGTSKSC